jgi:hypothetical protein
MKRDLFHYKETISARINLKNYRGINGLKPPFEKLTFKKHYIAVGLVLLMMF